MPSNLNDKINAELISFADGLAPSKEFIKRGLETIQNVISQVKSHPDFSVDRLKIGGSVGKKTSVLFPDFDVVMFLNEEDADKNEEILEKKVETLRDFLKQEAGNLGIIPKSIKNSTKTVSAEFYNGVDLDLLPAINFSQDVNLQVNQVIQKISSDAEELSGTYCSSLADIQVEFMKYQSGPTHQLIRLMKYWFKGLPLREKIYGGSYMMEIICSAVCYNNEEKSLLEKLQLTLRTIANISKARIAFVRDKNNEFRLLSVVDAIALYRNFTYKTAGEKKMGFIIDAFNPYKDLLTFKQETINDIEDYAIIMGGRLQSLEDGGRRYLNESGSAMNLLTISMLFKPVFISVEEYFDQDVVPISLSFEWEVANYQFFNSRVEIKRGSEDFFKKFKDAKMICEIYKNAFQAMIWNRAEYNDGGSKLFVYENGVAKLNRKDIVKEVENECTMKMFPGFSYNGKDMGGDYLYYIASISVPYQFKERKLAFRCTMRWEK